MRAIPLLLALVVACSSVPKTNVTPVVYTDGIDPYATCPKPDRTTDISVFYATDREVVDAEDARARYGKDRGLALRLGVSTVHLGTEESFGEIRDRLLASEPVPIQVTDVKEHGKLWTTIPRNDPDYDDVEANRPAIRKPAMEWAAALDKRLARTASKDVVIYVPGYKIDFLNPLRMTAQFHHFAGRDPVIIPYSWPASGSSFTYVSDAVNAGLSARNLREFVLFLGRHTKARRIHILGYSAGAPIVNEALLQLRLMHWGEDSASLRKLRVGHVVFVAPDDDVDYFRNLSLDRVGEVDEFFTIYATQSDRAMGLGRFFYFKHARLGAPGDDITERDLDNLRKSKDGALINAKNAQENAGAGSLSHAYWYENPWVSADIVLVLKYGLSPAERGLVQTHDGAIWGFPDDYPERARKAAQQAHR